VLRARDVVDPTQYPGPLVFTGPWVTPPANERPAFKDTVKAMPVHCHILEHEDNDMMRPYDVVG
jgi:spore coat protein A